jgi:molybdopterin-guanine dinucleotide biosynthesis protein A
VIGALLAGGAGRRMGGAKATRLFAGRPLAAHPAAALAAVCDRVVVLAKRSTELPPLPGAERWDEPDEPQHPLTGIVTALERAGEPVLVCAADMPFVTPAAFRTLIAAGGDAAVATAGGIVQPVLAVYGPSVLDPLRAAPPDAPLTQTVLALDPILVDVPADIARSINTPEDLAAAERLLRAQE